MLNKNRVNNIKKYVGLLKCPERPVYKMTLNKEEESTWKVKRRGMQGAAQDTVGVKEKEAMRKKVKIIKYKIIFFKKCKIQI